MRVGAIGIGAHGRHVEGDAGAAVNFESVRNPQPQGDAGLFEPKVMQMPDIDKYEQEVLGAFDKGRLKSVATKGELARFKAAARATAIKDRRVNIRLSSGDLSDIQVRALEEGVPYQTLIASVLHKYVTGRLAERPAAAAQARGPVSKRRIASAN